jgi:hypothetical protein
MKTITMMLLATGMLAITSCSKQPKACFNVEVQDKNGTWIKSTTGLVGEMFYFSAMCSENAHATGTVFDYGDGTTGTEENHEYKKPGKYTVKCTVFSPAKGAKGDKSDVATQSVVVKDLQAEAR